MPEPRVEAHDGVQLQVQGQEQVDVPVARTGRAEHSRRAAWTFVDQALSSLTNAALSILVARSVTTDAFGAFSIALVTFSFAIGLSRAGITDALVIRHSADGPSSLRSAAGDAAGAALVLGVLAGGLLALAGLALSGLAGTALLALAVVLPGLLVQDAWRYAFFAGGRPRDAAANDLVWAVAQLTAVTAIITTGHASVATLTLAWGGAALVAAVVGAVQARVVPRPWRARRWLTRHRDLSGRLGLDYVLNMGAVNAATYLVGAIAGLAAVGALRAAQVLLGPLTLAFAAASAFALPLLSRWSAEGRRLLRPAVAVSAVLSAITLVWSVALYVLPTSVGTALLGDSWTVARAVLPLSAAAMLALALVTGATTALKGMGLAGRLLRITVVQSPLILALGCGGAALAGAQGAAAGLALAQAVGCVLGWVLLRRASR